MAEFEARRRGRGYPPLPYEDPLVADRSDVDSRGDTFQIEGPNIHYVSSEREAAFWNRFRRTHPQPPEDIICWQQEEAEKWINLQQMLAREPSYAARLGWRKDEMPQAFERDAIDLGYPLECLSPEACRWTYIMQKRQEYAALFASGKNPDDIRLTNFFRSVHVDRKFITEPLTAEDTQAANAWKGAYLRRLRQEKTDESYINAYMQAWNLSSNDVFGMTK